MRFESLVRDRSRFGVVARPDVFPEVLKLGGNITLLFIKSLSDQLVIEILPMRPIRAAFHCVTLP